jgi:hypothetical protein
MAIETPDRKVTVGLAANAIMIVLAWISSAFFGATIPGEVALAGSTIILFALQYFTPNKGKPDAS